MRERVKLWHGLTIGAFFLAAIAWAADTKITALTALTGANLATGDTLVVVDVSDTSMGAGGTDKKTTMTDLLQWFSANGLNQVGGSQTARSAGHTLSATTATEVTDLQVTVPAAGTYMVHYLLMAQSATATVGIGFSTNFTGTTTSKACVLTFPTSGTTAGNGTADDVGANGQLMEAWGNTSNATGTPNLGPYTGGVTTTGANIIHIIDCLYVVSTTGDIELWHASETATSTTVSAGSSVLVTRTN